MRGRRGRIVCPPLAVLSDGADASGRFVAHGEKVLLLGPSGVGKTPNAVNALSMPANQLSWPRCGMPARPHVQAPRESPASPRTGRRAPPRRSSPGARRNRSAAAAPAASRTGSLLAPQPTTVAERSAGSSTVRRLTATPRSEASSWRTTSALPPCRTSRSSSQPSIPPAPQVGAFGNASSSSPREGSDAPSWGRCRTRGRSAWHPIHGASAPASPQSHPASASDPSAQARPARKSLTLQSRPCSSLPPQSEGQIHVAREGDSMSPDTGTAKLISSSGPAAMPAAHEAGHRTAPALSLHRCSSGLIA